jgi:hypothetical protein
VNVAIKKVGRRDGEERFVLVNTQSREVITVKDVTESALRRYFKSHGVRDEAFDKCLTRARELYANSTRASPVSETSDTQGEDDLLYQLGLDDESNVH